jgi:hypothetical protein
MPWDELLAFTQIALLVLNTLLVPLVFSGVRWVISVERRLTEIATELKNR